jgi:hypothetical protein
MDTVSVRASGVCFKIATKIKNQKESKHYQKEEKTGQRR